ncbi:MAG: tRNA 2-selenouridine(34) synthase MnmH [Proteobacteria bacterium]|nr:tRNA 2-selenouridine(34) synthase MnmH [Pseudomonadota bacterium]
MPVFRVAADEALARCAGFDALIDARSESEYAEDHLPGAVNWPSLNDDERKVVGTEYAQVSPFEAQKRGAMLVARNIARHIERHVLDKPKGWRPLVYCWRGGKRSGALATVLGEIGFRVEVLDGGYRAYRRAVIDALEAVPSRLSYRVICGPTGSGKTALLRELAAQGAQVLDLERLANHRGSVLGLVPGDAQPGQKRFESLLWDALRGYDPERPVYVESESRKVGDLRLPGALVERLRAAPCIRLQLPIAARVDGLLRDYDFFVRDPAELCVRLDALVALRGKDVVRAWQRTAQEGRMADLVRELLEAHYDPVYERSMERHFTSLQAPKLAIAWDGSSENLVAAARAVLDAS